MARKPARLERAGALTFRDRIWAAVRALQITESCTWSPAEVQFLANLRGEAVHIDTVESYLRALNRAEPPYVVLIDQDRPAGRGRKELALYRLVRDVGVDTPRLTAEGKPVTAGIGTERMWAAMKVLREFDCGELAHSASDEAYQVSEETANTYCTFLRRAGYIALAARAVGGCSGAKARYRFNRARNTGPRAPLISRDKSVMDANTGRVVWTPNQGGKGCKEQT